MATCKCFYGYPCFSGSFMTQLAANNLWQAIEGMQGPTQKVNFSISSRYTCLKHSDWFKILAQPIRMLKMSTLHTFCFQERALKCGYLQVF